MAIVTIEVDQECIDGGLRRAPEFNPIAYPLREKIAVSVEVHGATVWITDLRGPSIDDEAIALPPEARQWNRRFERGEQVEPIRFEMEIPERFLRTR